MEDYYEKNIALLLSALLVAGSIISCGKNEDSGKADNGSKANAGDSKESGKDVTFETSLEPGKYTIRANESDEGGEELAWCEFSVK